MAKIGGGFVEEETTTTMMREQSLLQATCGDLFDHIDDLLDFSKEESAADVLLLDAPPPPGSPISARIIDVVPRTARDGNGGGAAFLFDDAAGGAAAQAFGGVASCDDLDMAQLEWLSGLFDDTSIPLPHEPAFKTSALAANPVLLLPPDTKLDDDDDAIFRSSSPISVLEEHNTTFHAAATTNNNNNHNVGSSASSSTTSSSSSSSSAWSAPLSPRTDPPPALLIPARARSKRSRPSAFSSGRAVEPPTILVPTPMYSSAAAFSHSDPECVAESDQHNPAPPKKKKKKAKKPAAAPVSDDAEGDADGDADYVEGGGELYPRPQGDAVRRCTHCRIEKTPQWRAGPLGPKTLCNACGVRYKSGRLFPEYRPAASPTFVPSVHSNSHKKVVEMRQKTVRTADPSCDLLQLIRRRD